MKTDSKNFYSPVPNYAALRELEEKYYHNPTEKEMRQFLDFWQEVYDLWIQKNSPFESHYTEEKVKIRKSLIEKLGIRD